MHESLSILFVGYPLLTVSEESAGGAEQVLLTLEREMSAAGHRTTVAASNGSRVAGRLLATGRAVEVLDAYERREREHCDFVLNYLRRHPGEFDLIHDHSGSFFRRAGECPPPVLATLHLPRSFYRVEWLQSAPDNLCFNCVSQTQARSFDGATTLVHVVENGIDCERFPLAETKDNYLLWLGRICEEKAPHLSIAAAQRAGLPLVIAGQVYPFRYHRDYFDREVQPHLFAGSPIRYISGPSFAQKLELLRHARALLLTSTVEETSSLVAMEAMACGTPVVAMHRGAFPEIVSHGETGFVADTVEEMVSALDRVNQISGSECRFRVQHHFNARTMAYNYERLYRRVMRQAVARVAA
ncbi:MAG: glycosyltransferase [Candidatus Korobacteraceae bacterium]